MKPKKFILITDEAYSEKYEYLLADLFGREIVLFCAWGKYCSEWELAMDLFITDPNHATNEHHITTTSHQNEPLEEVLNLAKVWVIENSSNEVEIIRL